MLPAHVRDPEAAAFWLTDWFNRLGAARVVPEEPVTVVRERSGAVSELQVEAVAHLPEGLRLDVSLRLDRQLQPRWYTFDLVGPQGRLWGRHGHPERAGFHHDHDPPNFEPKASGAPATLLDIEALLHRQ